MILTIYNNDKIISVLEAPKGGMTHYSDNRMAFTGTIEDTKAFFEMKGFDTSKIDEYKSVSGEFTQ